MEHVSSEISIKTHQSKNKSKKQITNQQLSQNFNLRQTIIKHIVLLFSFICAINNNNNMKCFTAIVIAACLGIVSVTNAHSSHNHHHSHHHVHEEKDDLKPHPRRLSDGIFGHDHHDDTEDIEGCGAQSVPMKMRLGVKERVDSWLEQEQVQEQQPGSLRRLRKNKKYKIDVRFVQIKPNSTVPTLNVTEYRESIREVNRDFRGSGFAFRLVETVSVVDEKHSTCSYLDGTDFETGLAYRQGNATMLNVLLCDSGLGTAGFAYQPYYLPFGDEFFKTVDAVFMKEKNLNAFHTLTHEIGHWLGLDHTYWSGCDFPGDGIDDTPYHDYTDNETCDVVLDTCPDKPGLDPIDNWMSYTKECGKKFTQGQHDRMRAVYESFRLNLHETDACEFEVDVQFDDKPEQVKIFVESNDWYDYLIVHGEKYAPNGTYTLSSYFTEGQGSLTILDQGGDGMGSTGSVSLYLLDFDGNRYPLASVLGSSVQDMLMVNFTVPSGCTFAPTQAPVNQRSRRGSKTAA